MIELRTARNEKEVDRAYELAAGLFGPDYEESLSHKQLTRSLEPLEDLRDVVILADDQKILGLIRIINRHCSSPVGQLKVGGITSVCIHSDLQGQGWGTILMEGARQRSLERKDDFSLLFSRRVITGWYSKIGYLGIGCKSEIRLDQLNGARQQASALIETHTGVDCSYLGVYSDAFTASYSGLPLTFNRIWHWWNELEYRLSQHHVEPENFINVMAAETPIGYFIKSNDHVIEAAALDEFRAEFLTGMLNHCRSAGEDTITVTLPSGHWCMTDLPGHTNGEPTPNLTWNHSQMVRVLNKDPFREIALKSCSPEEFTATQNLFDRADIESHEGARQMLSAVVGQDPVFPPGGYEDLPVSPTEGQRLLPSLPYWALLDEI